MVKLHLANAGYDVTTAADAIEGGHSVLRTFPDLIICDVVMPYMDGYEFVAALKAEALTRDIPVIFLTIDDDVADKAKKLGAVAYLKKPATAGRLMKVVGLFTRQP